MMYLMTPKKGDPPMHSAGREVLVFAPTPNEYEAVRRHVGRARFENFTATVVESGPGKINATFKMAAEILPRLAAGRRPAFVVGAGTSGSLSLDLAAGDLIASASVVISDWQMEDDAARHHGPYGQFTYQPLESGVADELAINCPDPLVGRLLDRLRAEGFKEGRMMTSDTFVAGSNHKLNRGREFNCLACDMESGAFAFTAQNLLGGLSWFNLRVVADTLDETLHDYFTKELDMTEILGDKTVQALAALDALLHSSGD